MNRSISRKNGAQSMSRRESFTKARLELDLEELRDAAREVVAATGPESAMRTPVTLFRAVQAMALLLRGDR